MGDITLEDALNHILGVNKLRCADKSVLKPNAHGSAVYLGERRVAHASSMRTRHSFGDVAHYIPGIDNKNESIYLFIGHSKSGSVELDVAIRYTSLQEKEELTTRLKEELFSSEIKLRSNYKIHVGRFEIEISECTCRTPKYSLEDKLQQISQVKLEKTIVTINPGDSSSNARIQGIQNYFLGQGFYRV